MLRNATNNVLALHINGYNVLSVYMRGKLVWAPETENPDETILSCYFNGYWIDEYPWTDDTSWTD